MTAFYKTLYNWFQRMGISAYSVGAVPKDAPLPYVIFDLPLPREGTEATGKMMGCAATLSACLTLADRLQALSDQLPFENGEVWLFLEEGKVSCDGPLCCFSQRVRVFTARREA